MDINKIALCIKKLGILKLTSLQRESLKKVLGGDKSVVIKAPIGSGKTEAAIIPVMLKIASKKINPIAAIYITPLRALNRDIERRLKKLGECFELDIAVRHGDTPASIRKNIVENPPHILITTPESFNYIILNDEIRKHLKNLEYIVIDEYRDLVESKRGLLLLTSIHLLESYLGKNLVKIALTATLSGRENAIKLLSPESQVLVISDTSERKMDIKVIIPEYGSEMCKRVNDILEDQELSARIGEILEKALEYKYTLLFTNTRTLAESLGVLLKEVFSELKLNLLLEIHHGSLSKEHRERVEKEFKERVLNMIVATSSLELGIDIGHVEYVIQYMSPRQVTHLVQRIGRSRHRLGDTSRGCIISTSNLLNVLESATIAYMASMNNFEEETIHYKPLDVLAYAIALYTAINAQGVYLDELYELIKKHPLYSSLSVEEYRDVIEYLAYEKVIKLENKIIKPRKTRLYLYKTTMIPSTREIPVIEIASNRKVGVLDEEYVAINLHEDDIVVLGGKPWRVISYDDKEGKLYAEPAKIESGEILVPHWEGENIPVEYSIAQEIGRTIRNIKEKDTIPEDIAALINGKIEVDPSVKELGDDKNIYVDYIREHNLILVNVYGGSRVNKYIKDILDHFLKKTYPRVKLTSYSTPYFILIELSNLGLYGHTSSNIVNTVYNVIKELYKYTDTTLLKEIIKDSKTFLWRIYQVAQRFGAITPGTSVTSNQLRAFSETIIGKEAFNEVLVRDYDIDSTRKLAERINRGEVNIVVRENYDVLKSHHLMLLEYVGIPLYMEIVTEDANSFFERLLDRRVTLLCLNCEYSREDKVRELLKLEQYSCPRCKLATLTLVKGDTSEERSIIRKIKTGKKLSKSEKKLRENLATKATLLYNYGQKALLVLATRGVGLREAIRKINNIQNGADILKELYDQEKQFLRIKKYLKIKRRKNKKHVH